MKYNKAKLIMVLSLILIISFGVKSFGVALQMFPDTTFNYWFNGDISGVSIVMGFSTNILFGFIDNAGLFFGCSYLDELFELLPGASDANVTAGYGNTYSDFLILKDSTAEVIFDIIQLNF